MLCAAFCDLISSMLYMCMQMLGLDLNVSYCPHVAGRHHTPIQFAVMAQASSTWQHLAEQLQAAVAAGDQTLAASIRSKINAPLKCGAAAHCTKVTDSKVGKCFRMHQVWNNPHLYCGQCKKAFCCTECFAHTTGHVCKMEHPPPQPGHKRKRPQHGLEWSEIASRMLLLNKPASTHPTLPQPNPPHPNPPQRHATPPPPHPTPPPPQPHLDTHSTQTQLNATPIAPQPQPQPNPIYPGAPTSQPHSIPTHFPTFTPSHPITGATSVTPVTTSADATLPLDASQPRLEQLLRALDTDIPPPLPLGHPDDAHAHALHTGTSINAPQVLTSLLLALIACFIVHCVLSWFHIC